MTKGGRNNKPRRLLASFMRAVPVVAMMLAVSQALYIVGVLAAGEFTVSLTDSLFTDVNGNLQVNMGDTVQYTAAINNTSGSAQTNVTYANTIDANTTLVPGSVKTTPIARHDSGHSTVGNVQLSVAAPGVLANDSDPDGGALTVNGVTGCVDVTAPFVCAGASASGGDVTLNADGSFTFNPAPGFSGSDTFTYTVRDADSNTDPATVSITVGTPVWFINSSSPGPGDGRFTSPFSSVANYTTLAADDIGDTVFVYQGAGAYTGTLTLLNTQQLIGHGVGLTVAPNLSIAAGTRPVLANITLASGNTVRGLNVNASSGTGISGGSVGALTINNVSATNTAGTAVSLTGGALTVTFDSVSATGGASGLVLVNTTGSFTSNGGTIQNSTSDGVSLSNATNITLSGMTIQNIGRHGIAGTQVNTMSLTNVALTTIGDGDAEDALYFATPATTNLTGTLTMSNVDVSGFTERGLYVLNNSGNLSITINATCSFIDNSDSFGTNAIHVESAGTAGVTLNVNGATFDNVELYGVHFVGGGSGTNLVTFTNNVITNAGGPDNFPSGGGIEIYSQNNATTRFTVTGNTITDAIEGIIVATAGPTQAGNLDGTIANNNISMDLINGIGDGIRLALDGFSAADDATFTIAITGNTLDLNSKGDDGIQVLHRDHLGDLFLRIENNTIRETVSEALRYFSDEDLGVFPAGSPSAQILFANNNLSSIDVDANENEIHFGSDDEAYLCVHMTGNTNGGGPFGTINFNVANASQTQITQANTGALSAANGGSPVTVSAGALLFNGSCTNPPLPTAFTTPALADESAPVAAPRAAVGVDASQVSLSDVGDFLASFGAQASRILSDVIESARVQTVHASGETVSVPMGNFDIGQAVTITYRVTVNNPLSPVGATQISTQGTLSANSITSILSDDPAVGGATDPTVTPIDRFDTTVVSLVRTVGNPSNASSVDWQIVFAHPVSGLTASNFSLVQGGGLSGATISGVGTAIQASEPDTTWNITVDTGTGDGSLGLNFVNDTGTDHDVTNAPYTGEVYDIDKTAPLVSSIVRQSPVGSPTSADVLVFRVTFNEAVTSVGTADFAVNGTTTATVTSVTPVSASIYDVTVSGGDLATFNGVVGLNFNAPSITDLAGNAFVSAEPSTDETYTVDSAAPTITSFTRQTPAASATNADTLVFRATFNEAVTGVDTADFNDNGTSTATVTLVTPVSASVYDVTVSGGDLAGFSGVVGLDFNAPSITDLAGNAFVSAEPSTDETYTLDNDAPTVTSFLRQTPAASATNADTLVFRVTFNEDVTDVDTADFNDDGTSTATVLSVTPVSASVYDVTVSGGDLAGFNGVVGLNFNAPSITDLAGNAFANAEPSTDETYTLDNDAPTVSMNSAATDPTSASPIPVTVQFSEAVTGFDAGDITPVVNGVVGNFVAVDGDTYTFDLTPTADGPVTADIGASVATDLAGNPNTAATQFSRLYDTGGPTVSMASAIGSPTNVSPIPVTVQFSEAVTGFDVGDITPVVNGAVGNFVAVDGDTYTFDLTPTADGLVSADIGAGVAQDAASNGNSAASQFSRTYDGTAPDVAVEQAVGQLDPTNASPIAFTATFTEPVTGFDGTDVTVGGTANPSAAVVTEIAPMDGTTYKVEVSGMANDGTVTASIASNKAQDAVGNGNDPSTSGDNTVTYDTTAPDVTVEQAAGQLDPAGVSPIEFTAVFTEPVTGFDGTDLTLGGTANPSAALVTEIAPMDGTTYKVEVSGMANDGTVTASIASNKAQDAAGNGNTASTSGDNSVLYDTTPPDVTIEQAAGQVDPTNASPIDFTAVFTEPVSGFNTAADVTLGGTALPTTAVITEIAPFDGTTYKVEVSGMTGDGTVTASIPANKAQDAAGKPNNASTSGDNEVTYDATAPDVTIEQAAGQADPTNVSPVEFTATFTEFVQGFDGTDITLGGSSLPTTAVVTEIAPFDGTTYKVEISGMALGGTVIPTISAGVAQDDAGNFNDASISADNQVIYDGAAPETQIDPPTPAHPTNVTSATLYFAGADDRTQADNLAFKCSLDGSVPAVCTSPKNYTGLGDGPHTFSVFAIDEVGNEDPTPATHTWTVDTTAPTGAMTSTAADPTNVAPIPVTVQFSETVLGFDVSDIDTSASASVSDFAMVDGDTYTFNLNPLGQGTISATIGVSHFADVGGLNFNADAITFTIVYDSLAPTVTVEQAATQADPTSASPIEFTVTFNEPVTGFTSSDVTVGGTALPTTAVVTEIAPNDGTTYKVVVSGMTTPGTVTASVPALAAQDAAGNTSDASTSVDNTVEFIDDQAPETVINSGPVSPTNSVNASFTFSGTDNYTAPGALTFECQIDGGAFSSCASPKTYSGLADGWHTFKVRAVDASGNKDATPATHTWKIDTARPSVAINQAASQSDPTNATQILFTAVFSEPVSGFTGADVTISGTAGATTATVTGGPVTYTVKVSGMTSAGSVVVTIGANKATDAAGNDNTASTSTDNRVTYRPDGEAPNTVINSHPDKATTSKKAVFTFSGTDNVTPANALTFECQLDGGGFSSCASPKTYNNLSIGIHTFKVRAKDAAGNVDATPATFTWEITTSAAITTVNMACGSPTPVTGKINFRLLDPEGDLLTMTFVSSSNQTLVPNANVHINGTGEIRTVVITGAPGVSGVSTVTFHLSDGKSITPLVITFKVGTNGINTINGTSGIDMIFGMNGADVINGGGGDDLICGGAGDDTLNGDAGNDTLNGGEGDDTLNGGLGNDTLRGANGVDVLTGNAGKDHFSGGPGLDEIVDYKPSEGDTKDASTP